MEKVTYVGMDVHLNSIAAVWRQAGGVQRKMTVMNTPTGREKLVKLIGKRNVWGCYEASSCGWEVYDDLKAQGWKMSVLAPTHIAHTVKGRKTKTDERDAVILLNVLMSHGELGAELPKAWVPPTKVRQDREVVRRRLKVAENLSRIKTGIRSLLQMHGVKRPKDLKTLWTKKYQTWLKTLSEDEQKLGTTVRTSLASQLRELEFFMQEVESLQQQVEDLATEPAYVKRVTKMTSRSGVGTLTAMTFLVELGDVDRFSNRRQVASYLGLVPTCFESGEANDRKGHITRMGPSRVRKVLNQAAWAVIRIDPVWKAWYTQLAHRRKSKKAIVAVMRRLGIELWQMAKSA